MNNNDPNQIHSHDLGLSHDLPRMIGRRTFLSLLGGASLAGISAISASAQEACVALPWETAGPYPGDGSNTKNGQTVNVLTKDGVIRKDLRTSFAGYNGSADGLEFNLELTLLDAKDCTPLEGYALYIWHCDALGKYSLYDLTDVNFLRGVGISDEAGKVSFTTIVPGCYDGRWPHIHFEIFKNATAAVNGETSLLTAQIALPEKEVAEIYAVDERYSNGTRNLNRIDLASDNVFSDNGDTALAQQTVEMHGNASTNYTGSVIIPIDFTMERSKSMAPPPNGDRRGPPPGAAPGGPPPDGPPPARKP